MVKTWTLYVKHYIIPFTYPYHIFLSFQPPQLNSQGKTATTRSWKSTMLSTKKTILSFPKMKRKKRRKTLRLHTWHVSCGNPTPTPSSCWSDLRSMLMTSSSLAWERRVLLRGQKMSQSRSRRLSRSTLLLRTSSYSRFGWGPLQYGQFRFRL